MAQEDVVTGVILLFATQHHHQQHRQHHHQHYCYPYKYTENYDESKRRSPKIKHFHGANILLCSEAQVIERILF